MSKKTLYHISVLLVTLSLVLWACEPAVTPTPEAVVPTEAVAMVEPTKEEVKPTEVKEEAPAPTEAPTEVPAPKFSEAPVLAEQVKAGTLPPLDERLPTNPLVVESTEVG
jgi:hypothetical protein